VVKKTKVCIHAEGSHSEHLPGIPVATSHHSQFFSQTSVPIHNWLFAEPQTFEGMQQTFCQMKDF